MGGISIWQLVIVAVIVVLLFGTKKLRGLGGDLGSAVKGFKSAMDDDDKSIKPIAEKKDTTDDNSEKQMTKDKDQA